MSGWICVEDELPKDDGYYKTRVMVGSMSPHEIECQTRFHRGTFSKGDWRKITHWQPLND